MPRKQKNKIRTDCVRYRAELGWDTPRAGAVGVWEELPRPAPRSASTCDSDVAASTAQLAGDLCRRATSLRRTLYRLPSMIKQRHAFLEIIKSVRRSLSYKTKIYAQGRC